MTNRLFVKALTLLGILAFGISIAQAEPPPNKPRTISIAINGSINAELIERVREAISKTSGDPLPAGLIVHLNSPGGDGLAALEIGRLLRQAQAHIFVSEKCSSACVFIFMGGVVRQAKPNSLGIHQARITKTHKTTKKREEVDTSKDSRARDLWVKGNREFSAYVREMGISEHFEKKMNDTPYETMHWLTLQEASELRLVGFEPSYLLEREKYVFSRFRINKDELIENTSKVLVNCADEVSKPNHGSFVRCYRLTLTKPQVAGKN